MSFHDAIREEMDLRADVKELKAARKQNWGGTRKGSGRKMGSQYLKASNWVEAQSFWMYAYEFTTQAAAFNASLKMEKVLHLPFQVRKVEEGAFAVITQYNPLSRV